MPNQRIRGNQITDQRTIVQNEHEERADAKRVTPVDKNGEFHDAANPAPVLESFIRDGAPQQVIEDTQNPANNRPLPVKLTGFDGDVKIQADNLNLETQLDGVYDSAENTIPDTVGDIAHERSTSTDKTKLTQRVTAKRGTIDTDTVSKDVSIHDDQGNKFTESNPLTISTNYEKVLEVIRSSKWMDLAVFDKVETTVSPDRTLINVKYYEDGFLIGEAVANFTDLSWNFELFRYLLDDDGTQLLDDDDTPLFLE